MNKIYFSNSIKNIDAIAYSLNFAIKKKYNPLVQNGSKSNLEPSLQLKSNSPSKLDSNSQLNLKPNFNAGLSSKNAENENQKLKGFSKILKSVKSLFKSS